MKSDKVCEDAAAAHKLAFIAQRTGPGERADCGQCEPFSSFNFVLSFSSTKFPILRRATN